jgi:hypothetical protein
VEIFLIKRRTVKWQEQNSAAKRLLQRTYNVTQTSTRRLVAVVDKTATLADSLPTLTLHVLQALRVDESLVAVAKK